MSAQLKSFVFYAFILVLLRDCNAAKRGKSKHATTESIVETTTMTRPVNKPGTDTMIYHNMRTNDRCECGAFKTPKKSVESPLYYQTAQNNFHCDETACKSMCLHLPAFSANRGLEILCAHLNSAVGLRPAVHYKNCNDNWMYAGMTPKEAICCENGKHVACKP